MEKKLEAPPTQHSQEYNDFFKLVKSTGKTEDKLRMTLDFMRMSLTQNKTPAFRDFWDAKRLCLEFFKESIAPRNREIFWKEYVELSEKIRSVKKILDEQSSFSEEQIDLAISSLEQKLDKPFEKLDIPDAKSIQKNRALYTEIQSELSHLNIFAGRIHSLRKELITTHIRIRSKNGFFERLSALGNQVFPKRKQLINDLSKLFISDIEQFIKQEFSLENSSFFRLKEEIKILQQFAKLLTISSTTFMKVRQTLSTYWDQIKEKETVEKGEFKENFDQIALKIQEMTKAENLEQAEQKEKEIAKEIKELQLGSFDVKRLKKQMVSAKKPFEEKAKEEREKQKKAEELERKRQSEEVEKFLEEVTHLQMQAKSLSLKTLVEKWEALVKGKEKLVIEGSNQLLLENQLREVKDCIEEKKWQNLSQESSEDIKQELRALLDDRYKEKRKIKDALESHRKKVGGSSLDLSESMLYQEIIREEKERLDAIEIRIEEMEEKLFDLE